MCSIEERDDATIVRVSGDVDVVGAPTLRQTLIEVLAHGPSTHLIIDLSRVPFIDSTGIGVVAAAYRRVTARNGRFSTVATSEAVLRVLEMTGLVKILRVTSSLDDALRE
ncbi:MAG: STAS domain-containing protein [Frankiaceae bacterium]|nr:STAS domain-containing protein [Frankiaceae bacterium]MBV9869934.1 STAS domain-containing protein [Frankiaceae bacterium]